MAAPKPRLPRLSEDCWELPLVGEGVEFDERRIRELLKRPGVIVYHGDPERAKQFTPLKTVGHMSLEELGRLMGRDPDPDDENDPWYWGEDEEDDADPDSPIGS